MGIGKFLIVSIMVLFLAGAQEVSSPKFGIRSISTTLSRITNGLSGAQTDQNSAKMSFSSDGRYVVFESDATNLVSGDTNGLSDIFLYDTSTSTMTLVSVGLSSAPANGQSFDAVISGDGNYIVFASFASNLVASDTNGTADVFRYTRSTGAIVRVSVDSSGTQSNGPSGEPSVSYDGSLISFTSRATNLVASDTNAVEDIFLRDMGASTTSRISVNSSGTQGDKDSYQSKISSDGTVVVFASDSTNLVCGDSNTCSDVFMRVLSSSTTLLVSSSSAGTIGNRSSFSPSVSSNGQYVAFQSRANNLVSSDINGYTDIFVKNMTSGATTLVSQSSAGTQVSYDSTKPTISLDGRFVVFESRSPDYVGYDSNGVSDAFVRDTWSGTTTPISSLSGTTLGDGKSVEARISGDGSKFGFTSLSTNLVTTDTNGKFDLFARANPLSGQVVTVTAIGDVTEAGGTQNAFTFTRYGSTTSSLTVHYTVSGTATSGTDYTALSGTITIAASASTATLTLSPIDDSVVEADETVIVTITDDSAYYTGGVGSATVKILNDDLFQVNIVATDNIATEDGVNRGNFRITRTTGGTFGDLVVNLSISGTATPGSDYVALPSTVIIPAGQTYVDLAVIGLEDTIAETSESIIATVTSGTGYTIGSGSSDTVTLEDDDLYQVNISATDPILNESDISDTGTFRIDRGVTTAESLTVNYALKGTAQNGVDYVTLSGSATIAASSHYVDVTVTAISNASPDGFKSIIVDLIPGPIYTVGASQAATLVIKKDSSLPVVSIVATDSTATEDGTNTGNFRISRTGSTSSSLTVSYAIGGTASNGVDYTTLSGSATIASGQSYVDITVTGIEDTIVEDTETVILALQSSANYVVDVVSSQAQVNILDNDLPTVQIFRDGAFSSESQSQKAKIRVVRSGDLSNALTVNLSLSGTAVAGTDYVSPGTSITIAAGQTTASTQIAALPNGTIDGNRKATISLGTSIAYTVGNASFTEVTILDGVYKVLSGILGITPNADVSSVSISNDGRYVAFASAASNLVSGDANGVSDIFVVDTTSATITRVMALGGAEPNGLSESPRISADGRFVVFASRANNFYTIDLNQTEDIFIYEISTHAITYVSKGPAHFSVGGDSLNPYISTTGDFVVFESTANNLILNDTNQVSDVFLYTRTTGSLERVSVGVSGTEFSNGSYRPSVSDDGNLVAFETAEPIGSDSDTFTDIMVKNRGANTLTRVSAPLTGTANDGSSQRATISANGSSIVYESMSSKIVGHDLNNAPDIFKFKVSTQSSEIVSKTQTGINGDKGSVGATVDVTGDLTLFVSNSRNFGGSFNCTTAAYLKSLSLKSIAAVENGSLANCSSPVKEAFLSGSGRFVGSLISSSLGFREIVISPNPLE